MVRVLVVEDEANIRDMIALNLRHAGMEVVEAESAEAALPLLAQKPGCDAAILDVMLPGMNGFSLCETIRRTDQQIGIIILSAKGQEQDKIRGLSIGADDYMTKPFSVSELLARVEALCRRVMVIGKGRLLFSGGMDPHTYALFRQAHTEALAETCRSLEETCASGADLKQAALLLAAEANAKRAAAQRILSLLGEDVPKKPKEKGEGKGGNS